MDEHIHRQGGHGRESVRHCRVFEPAFPHHFPRHHPGLRRVAEVSRQTQRKSVRACSRSFYLSDRDGLSAQDFHQAIRGHWRIENRHWVKDGFFDEDDNGVQDRQAAVNLAVFNTLATVMLAKLGHRSIKDGQIMFACNLKERFYQFRT